MIGNDLIRVMVVDDDPHMRAGFAAILGEDDTLSVVAQADDGLTAIRMAEDLRPDVIVMDIAMPLIDGIRATRHITEVLPEVRVLTVSSHTANSRIRAVIDAGAAGHIVKSSARQELAVAVSQVANGMVYLSPSISTDLLNSILSGKPGEEDSWASVTPGKCTPRLHPAIALRDCTPRARHRSHWVKPGLERAATGSEASGRARASRRRTRASLDERGGRPNRCAGPFRVT